jgi:hypothetical protein
MEAEMGTQTQNFYPTHDVDITPMEERTHQAWLADTFGTRKSGRCMT